MSHFVILTKNVYIKKHKPKNLYAYIQNPRTDNSQVKAMGVGVRRVEGLNGGKEEIYNSFNNKDKFKNFNK